MDGIKLLCIYYHRTDITWYVFFTNNHYVLQSLEIERVTTPYHVLFDTHGLKISIYNLVCNKSCNDR